MAELFQKDQSVVSHDARHGVIQRLPEEFTARDVIGCFNLSSEGAARSRMHRLLSDHLIDKVSDGRGNIKARSIFRKTGNIML